MVHLWDELTDQIHEKSPANGWVMQAHGNPPTEGMFLFGELEGQLGFFNGIFRYGLNHSSLLLREHYVHSD
jgi:hypothetical protein